MADLARAQLASHNYAAAVESAETALGFTEEDDIEAKYPTERGAWRLSALLTAGLADYYLKAMDTRYG